MNTLCEKGIEMKLHWFLAHKETGLNGMVDVAAEDAVSKSELHYNK